MSTATPTPAPDRRSICAARSKFDSIVAEPSTAGPEPALPVFARDAMAQLRAARNRFDGRNDQPAEPVPSPVVAPRVAPRPRPAAEGIDLRDESARLDVELRLNRLANRAGGILDRIDRARLERTSAPTPAPASRPEPAVAAAPLTPRATLTDPATTPASAGVAASKPASAAAPATVIDLDELAASIRVLGSLRDEGLVTDEEFSAKKAQLLARI